MAAPYAGLPGLSAVCRRQGTTIPAVAHALHYTPKHLYNIGGGWSLCPPRLFYQLCGILECGPTDLHPRGPVQRPRGPLPRKERRPLTPIHILPGY